MLRLIGCESLEQLINDTVPRSIRLKAPLKIDAPVGERDLLARLKRMAAQNQVFRSYIGMGYSDTITPAVIQRNILENPGWYTQYTPYQAEIAQGRLEMLLNFQTMVADLTGLSLANASLLDEATAAAEAMTLCQRVARGDGDAFLVSDDCHPQTIAVLRTRAEPLGIRLVVASAAAFDFANANAFGALVQYPNTYGAIEDYSDLVAAAHKHNTMVVVATDLLALTLLRPPGEFGADVAVGSSQRFGVPLGFGGPHAAFIATRDEYLRQIPGRIVGVSRDAQGDPAIRLTVQTREQHIRRDKATSNICTAQVLLAVMAAAYAIYHGPRGLRDIAERTRGLAQGLRIGLRRLGLEVDEGPIFDTLRVRVSNAKESAEITARARHHRLNLRRAPDGFGVSLDETTTVRDVETLWRVFSGADPDFDFDAIAAELDGAADAPLARESDYLTHPVFNTHHSEHELLRYLHTLQSRDLSLTHSMIPLGSCTMKLNATSEMLPVTWPEFAGLHPFAPAEQTAGYRALFETLEDWLAEITGFAAISLQPNAGAQGEYAGLLVIRAYHHERGESQRDVCLIPVSAHGTNPASAVMAGFRVVAVKCDAHGNVDVADLKAKAAAHADKLAALMITYPSTHGVFEEEVREICGAVHDSGGLVYMDGANMNAQVGLCRPADIGADVCHLNLHKTFCIPHGGGGPGMGPIGVTAALAPFLPGHPVVSPFVAASAGAVSESRFDADEAGAPRITPSAPGRRAAGERAIGPVSAAPWGSAGILPISWMYIGMMGEEGLRKATEVAILNANYMAARLRGHFDVLFAGRNGRVAHEFIVDLRAFRKSADIEPEDVAKRLMDYGFHAPTMSWPVAGTLMIEPTESEAKAELDRFCDALIAIRQEIRDIEQGKADRADNALKNAPHTAAMVTADTWGRPYPRTQAAYPAPWLRNHKFWPAVARIDNVWGDRNPMCQCPSVEETAD